jgi:hypothetical protein
MRPISFFLLLFFFLGSVQCALTQEQTQSFSSLQSEENVPIMTFEKRTYDFGKVKKGENPSHIFSFVNKGDTDLKIEFVSGCDCTNIQWPEGKTFKPGEGGEIKVTYLTEREEERGKLEKTIDILLENIDPKTGYPIIEELKYKVEYNDE